MKACLTFLGMLLLAATAHAGTFSTAAWTNDASTGIVSGQTAWAYHFGTTTSATVNGVSVIGSPGPTASNANFSLAGTDLVFNVDSNDLTALTGTGSAVMANDFVYNGNPATITVNGLTVGNTYTVSFLSVGFEGPGFRMLTFTSASDTAQVDQGEFGDDKGIRVDYTFTATATTRAINIAINNGNAATFHLYGLALRSEAAPTNVTNANDSGTGSLRWALANAADRAGADTVSFAPGLTGPIVLSSEIVINDSTGAVTLDASTLPASLTIDGGPGTNRIFSIAAGSNLSLTGLRLTGGNGAGAVQSGSGGAILNSGTLLLTGSIISGNTASGAGAIYSPVGSSLTLVQCTLSSNRATSSGGYGGAIVSSGILTLTQCTLSANQCDSMVGGGGAIRTAGAATATLTNCTFAGNSAPSGSGGAIYHTAIQMTLTHCTLSGNSAKTGGAYYSTSSALTLTNSLIAGNKAAPFYPDLISSATPTTTGVNFIGDLDGSNLSAGPSILTGDPLLAPLASNGGPTQTMALRAGSPALDAATVIGGLTGDQRGFARIRDGNGDGTGVPDIGAFESLCLVVTTAVDELDPLSSNGTGISLREALRDGVDLITFAPGFTGPIVLGSEIVVNDPTRSVAVDASTLAAGLTLSGSNAHRLFSVSSGSVFNLRGVTLTGGNAVGASFSDYGGALFNQGNTTLTQCTLADNRSYFHGGAIYSRGPLTLTNCTLTNNSTTGTNAGAGGAIGHAYASMSLTHCTISGNSSAFIGGAISVGAAQFTLTNCIVAGNTDVLGTPDIYTEVVTINAVGTNFVGNTGGSGLTAGPTILTGDPLLAPLADNGGPTQTMALKLGSPALDAVPLASEVPGLNTDQRGFPRKLEGDGTGGAAVDIGAFELSRIIVTTTADELNTPSANGSGISLREALRDSPAHGVITFDSTLAPRIIVLGSQLEVTKDVTLDANSVGSITVSGNNATRVFHIASGVRASFFRLTISNGSAIGDYGAGVYVAGALDLTECSLTGNSAFAGAAAALTNNGVSRLTLNRCTVDGNTAAYGGGIQNEGTLVCTQSTFANNSATGDGGAISAPFGKPVLLRHCTVSLNNAATGGGAIGNAITLENSIVAGNTAPTDPNISGTPILKGTNLTSGDPRLTALTNFGGPTETMVPITGSPAIDQAKALSPALTSDQRGLPRPLGVRPDIGAVEGDVIIVTTPVDELDAPGALGYGVSLREAIRDVPAFGAIAFDRAVFNSTATNTLTLTKGPLNPQRRCFISGSNIPGGINIIYAPTITAQPQPLSLASGAAANFGITVTNLSGGVAYQWRKDGSDIGGQTSASLNLTNVQPTDEALYDVRLSEATAPGSLLLTNVVLGAFSATSQPASLIVDGAPVTIQRNPVSAMLALGSTYTLSVVAIGPATPALTFQWKRNGVTLSGATKSSYTIANAQLAHAGAYTCLVKSGTTTATSMTAEIGVVDTRPKTVSLKVGGSTTMAVSAAGNGLQPFVWKRDATVLIHTAKSFPIKSVTSGDAGLYTCTVTGLAGTITTGCNTSLFVSSTAPQLKTPLTLPPAYVGQAYFYQVLPNTTGIVAISSPTSYSVTGALPAGMTFDKATGILSGRPTTTKVGGYPLTFRGINIFASSVPITATLIVNALPTTAVGTFAGPMERSTVLNGNLGGRFDLTTSANGLCSGYITLGARPTIRFVNQLLLSAGTGDVILRANIPGVTLADKTALIAYLEVFANDQRAVLTLVHPVNGTTLQTAAWRNPWLISKTPALNNPATPFAAVYTARLDAGNGGTVSPSGYGYTSFTVKTDGTLTLAGKLPDGSAISGGTFVSKDGEIALFNLLYATNNRGTHVGQLIITPATPITNNTLAGTTTWNKPAPLSATSTDTVYKNGFGPLTVTTAGGVYVAAAKGTIVPGFTAVAVGSTNAKLSFTLGNLDVEGKEFTQLLRIANPSAASLVNTATPAAPISNSTKLTTFTASTGLFTGSFTINGATTALNRPGPFYGQLVKIGATTQGYGYFMLPTATAKISTSPKLSSRVVLSVP